MITQLVLAAALLGGYTSQGTFTQCEPAPADRVCAAHPGTPVYEFAAACNAEHGLGAVELCSDCTPLCSEPVSLPPADGDAG